MVTAATEVDRLGLVVAVFRQRMALIVDQDVDAEGLAAKALAVLGWVVLGLPLLGCVVLSRCGPASPTAASPAQSASACPRSASR